MAITLTVLEGSRPEIGGCLLLEYEGKRLLLDCGYDDSQPSSQGRSPFPVPAATIHAVVLSHGHLGHCGLLPLLAREGFAGKVYGTTDTSKIAMLSMWEAALLQEEQRQYWVAKDQPQRGAEPMYSESEVTACRPLFAPCPFGERVPIDESVTIEFFRAGHCPGSAFIKLDFRQEDCHRKILYIGDMGARSNDLDAEPVTNDSYDSLLLPAFRAARQNAGEVERKLAEIINAARAAGGNVLIPASSIDRRDAILQTIQDLSVSEQIPSVFVFLDSPIASRQCEALPLEAEGSENYLCLRPIDTVADSKSLNQIRGTAVIIAGSGRGGYGRIEFHLKRNVARPECALILFEGRPGRSLDESLSDDRGALSVLGHEVQIKAHIYRLDDPTVHLDVNMVTEWLSHVKSVPQRAYITHGTQEARAEFCSTLQRFGIRNVRVPVAGEQMTLMGGPT